LSKSDRWKTWGIALALILFAGVASAFWPQISEQINFSTGSSRSLQVEEKSKPIVIKIEDYVLGTDLLEIGFIRDIDGRELSQVQAVGILAGATIGGLVAMTLPLAGLYFLLSKQVTSVLASDSYQEAQAAIQEKQKAQLKERQNAQPTAPTRDPLERSRWSFVLTALIALIFIWLTGEALTQSIFGEATRLFNGRPVPTYSLANSIVVLSSGIILTFLVYRRFRLAPAEHSKESDAGSIDWDLIWVIVSGAIIVGVGTGLALAIRASASG
jgi:asparagine N-glycosylation enzyme membrane subunit Stt3